MQTKQFSTLIASGVLISVVLILSVIGGIGLPSATADGPARDVPRVSNASTSGDANATCRLPWVNGTDMDTLRLFYNSEADEFMAWGMKYYDTNLWGGGTGSDWEYQTAVGLRLAADGGALGMPVKAISDTTMTALPALAHRPVSNTYLLAWGAGVKQGDRWLSMLEARLLGADFTPLSERILLNAVDGYWPQIAYNADDDGFLVVWYDEEGLLRNDQVTLTPAPGGTPTPTPIPTGAPTPPPYQFIKGFYSQRLRGDGTRDEGSLRLLLPSVLQRGDVTGIQMHYNSQAKEYLVIWTQEGQGDGLYVLRLDRQGVPLSAPVRLDGTVAAPFNLSLAYDGIRNQYFLLWDEAREPQARGTDVYGLLLSAVGEAIGQPFAIRATSQYERSKDVVFNPVRNEYLVAWDANEDSETTETHVKTTLQRISAEGTFVGEPIETLGGAFGIGANPTTGAYLVLERFGYQPKPLEGGSHCIPTATPSPTSTLADWHPTATPTAYVSQRRGTIVEIDRYLGYGEKWLIRRTADGEFEMIVISDQSRVDQRLGSVEVGADVFATTHAQILAASEYGALIEQVTEHVAIVRQADTAPPTPTGTATPTATPTATSTPTATATGSAPRASLFLPHLAVNQAR